MAPCGCSLRGRARAEPQFSPDGQVAATIAAICRRLDGIPLALELAAARTNALGVEALATRLDDCFQLLTGGRRTALPRHQTLRATLDWSHQLLPELERVVLRRLAIFAGGFTLQAATTVAATDEIGMPIRDLALSLRIRPERISSCTLRRWSAPALWAWRKGSASPST
jgi:predicted ATPase